MGKSWNCICKASLCWWMGLPARKMLPLLHMIVNRYLKRISSFCFKELDFQIKFVYMAPISMGHVHTLWSSVVFWMFWASIFKTCHVSCNVPPCALYFWDFWVPSNHIPVILQNHLSVNFILNLIETMYKFFGQHLLILSVINIIFKCMHVSKIETFPVETWKI